MNSHFKDYFDQALDRCEFEENLQLGLIFFLGNSIISSNTNQMMNLFPKEDDLRTGFHQLVNLYGEPQHEYNPFDQLDTAPITQLIYTYSHIVTQELFQGIPELDQKLSPIPNEKGEENLALKTDILQDFADTYTGKKYKLSTCQQLNTDFFKRIGNQLKRENLSKEEAYKAGVNYYQKTQSIDFEGCNYLNLTVINSLSPLYTTLIHYPILYSFFPNELNANHLFSSILQFFYINANRDIAKHVHAYHQYLFYDANPRKVRNEWDFEENGRGETISQLMFNTIGIQQSPLRRTRPDFLTSDNYIMNDLKNKTIYRKDFMIVITDLIERYYETTIDQMIEELNHGEYLQMLAVMYYETAVHAMIVKEILPDKK